MPPAVLEKINPAFAVTVLFLSAFAFPSTSEPALIVVAPVKEPAPLRVREPPPAFVSAPAPLIALPMATLLPFVSNVAVPLVSVTAPTAAMSALTPAPHCSVPPVKESPPVPKPAAPLAADT